MSKNIREISRLTLAEMAYKEVQHYLELHTQVVLPLGSTEEHSGALPLGADTVMAIELAKSFARRLGWLTAPPIAVGYSGPPQPFLRFPGTISLRKSTLAAVIFDYVKSLYGTGFRNVYFVSGHGGNTRVIRTIAPKLVRALPGLKLCHHRWWKLPCLRPFTQELGDEAVSHAGLLEASLMLYLCPTLVHQKAFSYEHSGVRTVSGIVNGDQRGASVSLGKKLFLSIVEFTVRNKIKSFEPLV